MKRYFLLLLVFAFILTGCREKKPDPRVSLRIRVEPSSAVITFDGSEAGKGDVSGRVHPGKYLVKAEAEGYETTWKILDLKAGSPKIVEDIVLVPCKGSVMLESTPSGAEVIIQGRKAGTTPLILKDLAIGKHRAELKAPGCASKEVEWTVRSARPISVTADLASSMGRVRITSVPEDARVIINGNPVGTTPYEAKMEQGTYQIAVELTGYEKYIHSVSVNQGKVSELKIKLDEKLSNLTVNSTPSGASVKINGVDYGLTPLVLQNIKPGNRKIVVSKDHYDSVVNNVNLPPGKSHTVNVLLSEGTGSIEFVTRPAGLSVYLNEKMLFVTEKDRNNPDLSKVHRIPNLNPGTYKLRFQHKRARKPVEKTVVVEKGKTFRFNGNVELWIPNAVIYMKDGSKKTCRLATRLNNGDVVIEPSRGISYKETKDRISRVVMLEDEER